jgi:Cellulase (glycosyl hydrolase family 5)
VRRAVIGCGIDTRKVLAGDPSMRRDNGLHVDRSTGTAYYHGRPVCLLAASEHYGAVINRGFDYKVYLDQMASEGLQFTRLFVLFRELQTNRNPYSPCKPESTDYVAPYVRTGPGVALDGLPRYDLEQWNPEFFARLHGFLGMAMARGVIVELTLLSNVYSETVWALSPLHGDNNVNSIGQTPWHDYMSTRNSALFNQQQRFVKKVLDEVEPYDNLIIEICNEPIGNFSQDGTRVGPEPSEVDAWQERLVEVVRSTSQDRVIAASPAWSYTPWDHPVRPAHALKVDISNVHPLDVMTVGEETFNLGVFMSADSRLREYKAFCRRVRALDGAVNLDEDNNASRFMDERGWTIHRQRAWIALVSGCHYDFIDFSVLAGRERSTADGRRLLRGRFGTLARFWEENQIWSTVLDDGAEPTIPEGCTAVVARDQRPPGTFYVYVAAEVSSDLAVPCVDRPVEGALEVIIPPGDYLSYWFAPETGRYFGWENRRNTGRLRLELPGTANDVVGLIKRTA